MPHRSAGAAMAARYWTPARVAEVERVNDERVRTARLSWGACILRVFWMIKIKRSERGNKNQFHFLRGHGFSVTLHEPIDVWDYVQDIKRFTAAWRSMRLRSPADQQAARRVLDEWERLGGRV
jgi:hypothetical protein